jgi:hypothetical protein
MRSPQAASRPTEGHTRAPDLHRLIPSLIRHGKDLRTKVEAKLDFEGKPAWLGCFPSLPAPIAGLTRCLLEEPQVPTEMLTSALPLVVFFAQGCRSNDDWHALSTGRYGKELLEQAWRSYESMDWPEETWLRNTCAVLAAFRHERAFGFGARGQQELRRLIDSDIREDVAIGLLTCAGHLWISRQGCTGVADDMPLEHIERHVFVEDAAVCEAAIWAWSSIHRERTSSPPPSPHVLNRLTSVWLGDTVAKRSFHVAAYALCQHMGLPRDAWAPTLSESQARQVHRAAYPASDAPDVLSTSLAAALTIAFHARNVWTDADLGALLVRAGRRSLYIRSEAEDRNRLIRMLEQMGEIGKHHARQVEGA